MGVDVAAAAAPGTYPIVVNAAGSGVTTATATLTVVVVNGGGVGGVKVLLTDSPFPFDLVARADLFIVRVVAGTDSGSTGSTCSGATTIAEPKRRFDLLALQHGTTAPMGEGSLSDGSYGAVCITINTDSSSLTLKDGTVLRHDTDPGINWSATGERIIKADIFQPIAVVDTAATFVIHFDVGESFIPFADVTPVGPRGWFFYVPAIDVMDLATTGAISGTVVGGPGTPAPVANASIRAMLGDSSMAPDTWFVAATGATDPLGHFKLAFLSPSSRWTGPGWVYIVEAHPPSTSTSSLEVQRIPGVTVSASAETALGTITLNQANPP